MPKDRETYDIRPAATHFVMEIRNSSTMMFFPLEEFVGKIDSLADRKHHKELKELRKDSFKHKLAIHLLQQKILRMRARLRKYQGIE